MLAEQLIQTWHIHNRIHLFMLEGIAQHPLALKVKGRSPGEHLAHVHNVRLMWLQQAAPEMGTGLVKFEKGAGLQAPKAEIALALEASAEAIAQLLKATLVAEGKIKGFKPHPAAFLGYLISHESHHRGQILLTLRIAGIELDKKMAYGLWEWGSR